MSFFIIQIQRQILWVTVFAAVLMGFSLAYLTSSTIKLLLIPDLEIILKRGTTPVKTRKKTTVKSKSEFDGILTGSFIRNSPPQVDIQKNATVQDTSEIIVHGLLAGDKRWASALIQVQGKKDIEEYFVGETVGGYFILEVRSNSIYVEKNSNRMSIEIGEKSAEVKSQNTRVQESSKSSGVSKSSISRSQLTALLNNEQALQKSKIAPFMLKGQMMGLRLMYVPNDHVFYSLGARSGDIIRRFNGEKLDSTNKLIQIYQGLRTLSKATIDLERGGKILTYEFVVTD